MDEAKKILIFQSFLVTLLTPFFVFAGGNRCGGSFLLGGVICILPTVYFYCRVFAHSGARAARKIVNAFYQGEAVKIVMTAVAFGVAFKIEWVEPLWLLIGYITAQISFWLAPFIKTRKV